MRNNGELQLAQHMQAIARAWDYKHDSDSDQTTHVPQSTEVMRHAGGE